MPALDDAALDRIFREGRTFNHYHDTPVTPDDARAIWDLVKMGPTSANQLPARFVWCLDQAAKDRLADCASDSNAGKIRVAPAAVVIGMDYEFHRFLPTLYPHTDAKSWFEGNRPLREVSALRNSSLQAGYFIVAARALGFDVGPMSGFDADAVNHAFFADEPDVRVNLIATLGHGDRSRLHERAPRPPFEQFNRFA